MENSKMIDSNLTAPESLRQGCPPGASVVDFDLHGLVGIRLLEASAADAAAVERQLGPICKPLDREPDIVIRFVDELRVSGPIRLLGADDSGFTEDAFLVLRSKHKAHAKVQIRFEQIGGRCEITCESGLPAVPLLIPILNLTALANGALPLHASAFTYNGTGVLTTGWSKGGKTETLLAFMSKGADYIGDEWVYITGDGKRMYGIPEPIRVWNWHLQELPHYRALVESGDKMRLRALELARAFDGRVSSGPVRNLLPSKMMRRMGPVLKRQCYVDMHPRKLFGQGFGDLAGRLEKIFFVGSHESPEVTIAAMDPQEIAERMVFSLQYERLNFMSFYLAFRFAFPKARNDLIENAEQLQRERLMKIFAGKDAYALYHPYPVRVESLFETIQPVL